jgi:hypothetical protein
LGFLRSSIRLSLRLGGEVGVWPSKNYNLQIIHFKSCLISVDGLGRNSALCPFYFGILILKHRSLLLLDMAATGFRSLPMDVNPAVHAVLPAICTFARTPKFEF